MHGFLRHYNNDDNSNGNSRLPLMKLIAYYIYNQQVYNFRAFSFLLIFERYPSWYRNLHKLYNQNNIVHKHFNPCHKLRLWLLYTTWIFVLLIFSYTHIYTWIEPLQLLLNEIPDEILER